MKILGLIPSRLESSRFPSKPLVDIHGKSMILRVYDQASKAQKVNDVFVATDSIEIKNEIEDHGGRCILTSDKPRNGTERCFEAFVKLGESYDVVINIQGDEPYIHPEQIDQLADLMTKTSAGIGTMVIRDDRPESFNRKSVVKVVVDKNMCALYFSRIGIPANADKFFRHIGMYAYRPEILKKIVSLAPGELEQLESLEQLRWLENGFKIHVVETDHDSESVDTPEDLKHIIEKYSKRNV